MKRSQSHAQDYAFGRLMLAVRSGMGLTQATLAVQLGVSRNAVGAWEAGNTYPTPDHLMALIALAQQHRIWPAEHAADAIRTLWDAARQKMMLDDAWIAALLHDELRDKRPLSSSQSGQYVVMHPMMTVPMALDLPVQSTSFVGRDAELRSLARLLGDRNCRLLTLLGPGGIGKTRLALALATAQSAAYPDGVVFVGLAALNNPGQLVAALGDALKLSFAGQPDPTAHLHRYLRARHMLLLLDNFEHLLAGANLIVDMLVHAPRITILVTSRERLNVQAEWLFDVDGLAYPPDDVPPPNWSQIEADLAAYSAVQLFVQRARQVQPGFPVMPATLATVVRICQQVAGIPLAIELAAASIRSVSLAAIEQLIRSNVSELATTLRDVPPRHRSIRAAFEHSWALLSDEERALFSRLAVFRGGWTLHAAAQLVAATLPMLTALVDKSLIRQARTEGSASDDGAVTSAQIEPRYTMLEPIREYALEQLVARGEAQRLQDAHARYYGALADAAAAVWGTPKADAAAAQLDREYDNLSAALQWTRDGGDRVVGLQLAATLRQYWQGRGRISEGRVWLTELLAQEATSATPTPSAVHQHALESAAWLASNHHDFAHAAQLFEQSAALQYALGGTASETQQLINAARQARSAGRYRQATALLEDAVARHRAIGDCRGMSSAGLGLSLYELALVQREQGNFARATELYHMCVELHQALSDREGVSCGLLGLSDIARDQGDAAQVRRYCEPSLAVFRELTVQWAIGFALNNLALAAYYAGELAQARAVANESVTLFRNLRADASVGEVLITLGRIALAQGDRAAAYDALREAFQYAQALGPRMMLVAAAEGLACLVAQSGQMELVIRLLAAASGMRAWMGTPARPVDQPAIEHVLESARSVLGADAVLALWAKASKDPLAEILHSIAAS